MIRGVTECKSAAGYNNQSNVDTFLFCCMTTTVILQACPVLLSSIFIPLSAANELLFVNKFKLDKPVDHPFSFFFLLCFQKDKVYPLSHSLSTPNLTKEIICGFCRGHSSPASFSAVCIPQQQLPHLPDSDCHTSTSEFLRATCMEITCRKSNRLMPI